MTLSGTNTYGGGTNINAGTLADGAANSFSSGSTIFLAAAGNLNVNFNETIRFVEEVERVASAPVSLIATRFHSRSIIDRRAWS